MIYLNTCIGRFSFDVDGKLLNFKEHKDIEQYINNYDEDNQILPGEEFLEKIMQEIKRKNLERRYREVNLKLTEHLLKRSATKEHLAVHVESAIDEREEWINRLSNRLREMIKPWFFRQEHTLEDNKRFAEAVLYEKFSLAETDKQLIQNLAKEILETIQEKEVMEEYINNLMKEITPNLSALCTPKLAAKLLKEAGSLKRLATIPSSSIQVIGAEKALFRHIKNKRAFKSPKHGVIFIHPLLQKATKEKKGKIARTLSDKISMAAKLDFFKGEFKGDELYKEVEAAL